MLSLYKSILQINLKYFQDIFLFRSIDARKIVGEDWTKRGAEKFVFLSQKFKNDMIH